MNKNIIILITIISLILIGLIFFLFKTEEESISQIEEEQEEVLESDKYKSLAQDWILNNSTTYLFDGFDLEFLSEEQIDENEYKLIFLFNSNSAGYGDRSDQMSAQVITPHKIEIIVKNNTIIEAITDKIFDEMTGEILEEKATMTVDLYFVKTVDNQEELIKVEREIFQTEAVGRASIEELLKGPKAEEREDGFYSALNEEIELQSIEIENGIAKLDFNQKLQEGVAGSARVEAIREQIRKTMLQFDTVNEVIISIDGEIENILQP